MVAKDMLVGAKRPPGPDKQLLHLQKESIITEKDRKRELEAEKASAERDSRGRRRGRRNLLSFSDAGNNKSETLG